MGFGRHAKDARTASEFVRTKLDFAQIPRTKAKKAPRHSRRRVFLKKDPGDWTPLELFLAGVHSPPADFISAAKALATIDPASQDT
jgi:hypothetical protein